MRSRCLLLIVSDLYTCRNERDERRDPPASPSCGGARRRSPPGSSTAPRRRRAGRGHRLRHLVVHGPGLRGAARGHRPRRAPTRSPPRRCRARAYDVVVAHLALGHDHRGRARADALGPLAHGGDHRRARHSPVAQRRPTRSSRSSSPTRSRSCRRASPPPRSALLRAHVGARPRRLGRRRRRPRSTPPLPVEPARVRPAGPSSAAAGPSGWPARRRSSCARRPRRGRSPTPRSSTATARSASPGRAPLVWSFGPARRRPASTTSAPTGALDVAPDLDPLASLVLAQRTAVALAEAAGSTPTVRAT